MTPPAPDARRIPRRAALLLIAAGAAPGCAPGLADRPEPTPAPARILYHAGRAAASGTVTLRPGRIAAGSGVSRFADVRLYLGGVGSLDAGGEPAPERLALVIQAARDSLGSPVLYEHRRVLLDIDGSLYSSSSLVDPRLYRYAHTELGYTETVLIPIDRSVLERLSNARVVTGRVGEWISFELSRGDLRELRGFLDALPPASDARKVVRPVTHLPPRIG